MGTSQAARQARSTTHIQQRVEDVAPVDSTKRELEETEVRTIGANI